MAVCGEACDACEKSAALALDEGAKDLAGETMGEPFVSGEKALSRRASADRRCPDRRGRTPRGCG